MKEVFKKIGLVQNEVGNINKNAKNPFFKSKYADLSNIKECLQPLLSKYLLTTIHTIKDNVLTTTIFDVESGESVDSSIELTQKDPQKKGSEITYFRRYNLVAIFDLNVDDDDGNAASKPTNVREIKALDEVGMNYLLSDKATKDQINLALKDRKMTDEQRTTLTNHLKTK